VVRGVGTDCVMVVEGVVVVPEMGLVLVLTVAVITEVPAVDLSDEATDVGMLLAPVEVESLPVKAT